MSKLVHGRISTYTHHGCRCDLCRAELRRRVAAWRAAKRASEPPEHGSRRAYQDYGCRCEPCRSWRVIAAFDPARHERLL